MTRTLAVTQNITVDGSIEMLGDWFDPQADSVDLQEQMRRQDRDADAALLGRQSFEDFRGYWPQQTDDTTGVTDYLNSTILTGDPVAEVRTLKEEPGKDIVVTGSITLCHALIDAGLVDQYRLFVYPVVQGRGRRLFPHGYTVPELTLIDAKTFRCGITYSCYAPA